jgi:hypothetical protein
MKEVKEKKWSISFIPVILLSTTMWLQSQQEKMDMISIILPCSSICFQSLLSLPLSHNKMASSNGNHKDKDNK